MKGEKKDSFKIRRKDKLVLSRYCTCCTSIVELNRCNDVLCVDSLINVTVLTALYRFGLT